MGGHTAQGRRHHREYGRCFGVCTKRVVGVLINASAFRFWTAGLLRSTQHRVVMPRRAVSDRAPPGPVLQL